MVLSRLVITNFRNFCKLDVALNGNIVIVGENRAGKSNLLYALRLLLDPTLPDSARQLSRGDFWDGLEEPGLNDKISIMVEFRNFDADPDVLAVLTDYRIDNDPDTVRLTYEFRPRKGVAEKPASDGDYEFVCYGGNDDAKYFGHDLRKRIRIDVLQALRDAEGDLMNWQRSPFRTLIERAFSGIGANDLISTKDAIKDATETLTRFPSVQELEKQLQTMISEMIGVRQDANLKFGVSDINISRMYRNVKLLIDGGLRNISDASLGTENIVYLALKILELKKEINENNRDYTFFSVEEPEAHLHPHLQRSIYRHIFNKLSIGGESSLSVILTTHSPHIVSITPLRSLVLLRETKDGTIGYSTAAMDIKDDDIVDLERYLDVTRAEMLFARGVLLVEGDAEKFLIPTFAQTLGFNLDHLGISICSVSGTNFVPYIKLLCALDMPYAVITDWDPIDDDNHPLGVNRLKKLTILINKLKHISDPQQLKNTIDESINKSDDWSDFCDICEKFGVFTNHSTLELDLCDIFSKQMIEILSEKSWGTKRKNNLADWKENNENTDKEELLVMIEEIGKGRFAQRLASRIVGMTPPQYIAKALRYVVARV